MILKQETAGDFFGERAIESGLPRAATVSPISSKLTAASKHWAGNRQAFASLGDGRGGGGKKYKLD